MGEFWAEVADMLRSGMTLDQIEATLAERRVAEMAALEREHRRRMWFDITLPFVVGIASLTWTLVAVNWSEWIAMASLPGVAWCQWKLTLASQFESQAE